MNNRYNQFKVTHALTTYFLLRNFYTTTVTHDAFVANTFVLAAIAFIILYWAKYFFAKQTITFGFVSTIVNRFGFQYFAIRTVEYRIGRCQADGNLTKSSLRTIFFFNCHIIECVFLKSNNNWSILMLF